MGDRSRARAGLHFLQPHTPPGQRYRAAPQIRVPEALFCIRPVETRKNVVAAFRGKTSQSLRGREMINRRPHGWREVTVVTRV